MGETTPDGLITLLVTGECIAACDGAPALQVNLEYCGNVTFERADEIIELIKKGEDPAAISDRFGIPPVQGPLTGGSPVAFEPVLTKGIGELDLVDIEVYEKQGGYQALRKALKQMTPEDVHAEVKKAQLARPRRRGLSRRASSGAFSLMTAVPATSAATPTRASQARLTTRC